MAKKKKKADFGDQSVDELMALKRDLEREVYQLRSELSMNRKLEKPHLLKAKRREKARVLTLLTRKTKQGAVA